MYGVIYVPDFVLQGALRFLPGDFWRRAVGVLDAGAEELAGMTAKDRGKARIAGVTEAAARSGVEVGMTATQGQARCAGVVLLERSGEGEAWVAGRLLECAERISPDFEATAGGVVTVDLVGCGGKSGGAGAFGGLVAGLLGKEGVRATTGAGETPDVALLAARAAAVRGERGVVLGGGRERVARFLAPLPVDLFGLRPGVRELLRLWGVRTLGEVAALPGAEAGERLGEEGAELWRVARGWGQRRVLRLVREPESFSQRVEVEYGIEALEPLLFIVRRLLETLAGRLAGGYRVASGVVVVLGFEGGKSCRRALRVPDPSGDVELLFRVVHTHLEGFVSEAPVVAVEVELVPSRPLRRQFSMFETSLKDPNRFGETLARLGALVGDGRVGMPEVGDSYRAEAWRMGEFREEEGQDSGFKIQDTRPRDQDSGRPGSGGIKIKSKIKDGNDEGMAIGVPMRRLRPVRAVVVGCLAGTRVPEVVDGVRVREARGPWLHSGDWWEEGVKWSREEWDVELEKGELVRLVREREGWFLEGRYGGF